MGEKLNKRMKGLQYAGREVRIGIYGVCKKKGNRRMRGFEHAGWGGKKKGRNWRMKGLDKSV